MINPTNSPEEFTIGNFSILLFMKIVLASSKLVPSGAVIKSLVITSCTDFASSYSKNRSLFVTIPNNLLELSFTIIPPILCNDINSLT